jgi:hypothetical protein
MSAVPEMFATKSMSGSQRVSRVSGALLVISVTVGAGVSALVDHPAPVVVGALVGLYLAFAVKVADQWEKAVVVRLGRYRGLRGPAAFVIIPIVDAVSGFVDQRVRVTDVRAATALARDTVPVNVDAVVFDPGVRSR